MDFSSRGCLCLVAVMAQVPTPEITERDVLAAGYAEFMQRADMIDNPAWRRAFFEDELSNRVLVARWKNRI
jgi:hypothetical protein